MASLRLLADSVKAVRVSDQLTCSSVLLRLENNINNYGLIVSSLQLGVSRTEDGPCVDLDQLVFVFGLHRFRFFIGFPAMWKCPGSSAVTCGNVGAFGMKLCCAGRSLPSSGQEQDSST